MLDNMDVIDNFNLGQSYEEYEYVNEDENVVNENVPSPAPEEPVETQEDELPSLQDEDANDCGVTTFRARSTNQRFYYESPDELSESASEYM